MKKLSIACITIITALVLILTLVAACAGGTPTGTETATTTITATATAAPTTVTKTATITATATTAAPQVFKWNVASWMTRGLDQFKYCTEEWAANLKKASGGRLDFTVTAGGEVIPTAGLIDAVSKGTVPMILSYAGFISGQFPVASFGAPLPFTLQTLEEHLAVLYSHGTRETLREAYAKTYNIYYLREMGYTTPNHILTKFPVTKVSDFQGKKMRVYGAFGDVMVKTGASGLSLAATEVYTALEKGTIDGTITGSLTYISQMGFYEAAKYIMLPPALAAGCTDILFNMDAWNSLPQDLRDLIYLSAQDAGSRYSASLAETDGAALKTMQSKGVKLTTLPPEEVKIMTKYSLESLDALAAKDAYVKRATDSLKELMKALGYLD